MIWKEIFTTYWAQTTMLLFGLGYLIKSWLDGKNKKTELNHSMFQEKRLEALRNFMTRYSECSQMWRMFQAHKFFEGQLLGAEKDIFDALNNLRACLFELRMYLPDKDFKFFEELMINFDQINHDLADQLYIAQNKKPTEQVIHYKSFHISCHRMLDKNSNLLKQLNPLVTKYFNS